MFLREKYKKRKMFLPVSGKISEKVFLLTHFVALVFLLRFFMFSGGIERDQWHDLQRSGITRI